jgi:hypothetical protein
MNTHREYRYSPADVPGTCPEHEHCLLQRCRRLWCANTVHVRLRRPGQPRRFCSTTCRVAEHRRLRM